MTSISMPFILSLLDIAGEREGEEEEGEREARVGEATSVGPQITKYAKRLVSKIGVLPS